MHIKKRNTLTHQNRTTHKKKRKNKNPEANILVDVNFTVKLSDFGCSKRSNVPWTVKVWRGLLNWGGGD